MRYKALLCMAAVVALVACNAGRADASLVLTLSDGVSTVVVVDDGAAGAVSSGGNVSTIADGNIATPGLVSFNGSIGNFVVAIGVGTSKPLLPEASIDLFNVAVTSGGAGTLTISVTDTSFSVLPAAPALSLLAGGTTDGTVSVVSYADAANAEFGMGIAGPVTGAQGPGAFSFSGVSGAAGLVTPYSMTITATVVHTGSGQISSFDTTLSVIPEPATCVIWSILGLGGIASARRRRRKVA
jgi:hypothetical protein